MRFSERKFTMKKFFKAFTAFLLAVITAAIAGVTASANAAQPHSIKITFDNIGNNVLYVALMTDTPTGLSHNYRIDIGSVINGFQEPEFDREMIQKRFFEYEDSDGFVYNRNFYLLDGRTLYIYEDFPYDFKVLVYNPQTDSFSASEIMHRYATSSNFTVYLGDSGEVAAGKIDYQFVGAILSLIIRMVFTVAVELLIALLFGYKDKAHIKPILITNIVTQLMLNIGLNMMDFFEFGGGYIGSWGALSIGIEYGIWEIAVFGVEALTYTLLFKKRDNGYGHPVLYAFAANLASYIGGLVLAFVLPGIF